MERALSDLGHVVCRLGEPADLSDDRMARFAANTVVALTAGGEGSRLQTVTESGASGGVHKTAFRLPSGDTMIERTIRMYRESGFHEFVALVFHHAQSIVDVLGDGSHLGVNITYSADPEVPVGRGGAILNALTNGSIPREKSLIVHNPDDVIIRYPGSFPYDLVASHLAGVGRGAVATAAVVAGAHVAYTGLAITDGMVEEVVAYPYVPIPAHIGVTVFAPEIYADFERLFSLTKKTDFEPVLFPLLASQQRLAACVIPDGTWLAVNDPKALNQFVAIVEQEMAGVPI
jgi:NDP-sugar pyrophosphorylase family protein